MRTRKKGSDGSVDIDQGPDSSLHKLDGNGNYLRYLPLPTIWSKFAIHERFRVRNIIIICSQIAMENNDCLDLTLIGIGSCIVNI